MIESLSIAVHAFELTKRRSKRYPAKTITDADYADDLAILANTPNQAETLLHSLERAAAGIGLHVNANKTEYMCYNQTGNIATLDGASLKLVNKFTYLGSSISSTEKDIDTRLTKAIYIYICIFVIIFLLINVVFVLNFSLFFIGVITSIIWLTVRFLFDSVISDIILIIFWSNNISIWAEFKFAVILYDCFSPFFIFHLFIFFVIFLLNLGQNCLYFNFC